MPKTIPAAGEAMPKEDMSGIILDARNLLSEIRDFNEIIFMSARAIENRSQMNAVSTIADLINERIDALDDVLASTQEAAQ